MIISIENSFLPVIAREQRRGCASVAHTYALYSCSNTTSYELDLPIQLYTTHSPSPTLNGSANIGKPRVQAQPPAVSDRSSRQLRTNAPNDPYYIAMYRC